MTPKEVALMIIMAVIAALYVPFIICFFIDIKTSYLARIINNGYWVQSSLTAQWMRFESYDSYLSFKDSMENDPSYGFPFVHHTHDTRRKETKVIDRLKHGI